MITLQISSIITDGLQMRASLNESAVNEYSTDMKEGIIFHTFSQQHKGKIIRYCIKGILNLITVKKVYD